MGAQRHVALAPMNCLEQKISSLWNVPPAFKNEEWILDIHQSRMATGFPRPPQPSMQKGTALPNCPPADAVWGSIPFSFLQMWACSILW